MRKSILVVVCLFLLISSVSSQRAQQKKKRAKKGDPVSDAIRGIKISPDEVLYDATDYSLLDDIVGWRLAVRGNKQADGSEVLIYHDPARITLGRSGVKQVWLKTENWKDGALDSYWMDLNEYDCVGRRWKMLEIHNYDKAGNATEGGSSPLKSWQTVIPDSIGEILHGVLCLHRKDQVRLDMEEAARWFMYGRWAEKTKRLDNALRWYTKAQELEPDNDKIAEALKRVHALRP
jgi:hypothetical protein